jgi:uncharacterized coiled-coil protein SlyX
VNPKEIALSIPHDSVIVSKAVWEATQRELAARVQPGPLNIDAESFLRGFPPDNASMYFGTYIRERFQASRRPVNRDELAARMETAARSVSRATVRVGGHVVEEVKARAWVAAADEAIRFMGSTEAPNENGQSKVARQKKALHELEERVRWLTERHKVQEQTNDALVARRDELEAELARVKDGLRKVTGTMHSVAEALGMTPNTAETASIVLMIKAMQEDNKRKFEAIERQNTELQGLRSGSLPYAGAVIELRRIMDDLGETCVGRTDAQKLNVVRAYLEARESDCERARKERDDTYKTLMKVRSLVMEPHTTPVAREYAPLIDETWAVRLKANPVDTSFTAFLEKTTPKVDVHRLLKEYFANNGAKHPNPSPQSIRSITQALNNQGIGVK